MKSNIMSLTPYFLNMIFLVFNQNFKIILLVQTDLKKKKKKNEEEDAC